MRSSTDAPRHRVPTQVVETRKQLREVCVRLKMELESCQAESVAIRKALLAGLFVNVAERNRADGGYRTLKTGQAGMIHPGSTLFPRKCSLVRWRAP